jgi:UDP-glucose 4-epimerase
MKILITGATGYLGGRIANHLGNKKKYKIILGTSNQKILNQNFDGIKYVETSWNSSEKLKNICEGVDCVIHLAAMNSIDSQLNPLKALSFNGHATERLINSAIKARVKKFIYFSTAHVYSNPLDGIITELTELTSKHPYSTSHKYAEDVLLSAHIKNEISGIILRVSNAFGSPVNLESNCWMLFVNDLCKQVATTDKMVIKSSVENKRDFISITNLCRVVEHFLLYSTTSSIIPIFNVGGGKSITLYEMASIIQKLAIEIFGNKPYLDTLQNNRQNVINNSFEYKVDKLFNTGFTLINNNENEIKDLLSFCKNTFTRT